MSEQGFRIDCNALLLTILGDIYASKSLNINFYVYGCHYRFSLTASYGIQVLIYRLIEAPIEKCIFLVAFFPIFKVKLVISELGLIRVNPV